MRLRRIVGAVTLAAALLVAAPLTAHADYEYPADEPPVGAVPTPAKSVSLRVKGPGETSIVQLYLDETFAADARSYLTVTGPGLSDEVIEIAGVAQHVTAAAGHTARFAVSIDVLGEFVVTGHAVNLAGQRVAVYHPQTITVVDAADAPGAVVPSLPEQLPVTGAEAVLFGIGAALLLAVGFFLILGARRRRRVTE